jgi:3-hydroxybutyryl-CoA dehydrogenase
MGAGIAQVCAASGYRTIVREVDDAALAQGLDRIRTFLDGGVAKGKASPRERDETLGRLSGTTAFDALKDCDIVLEAIVERLDAKRAAYDALDRIVGAHTLFLSNTSSICITELAAGTRRPDRFAGLHFFNPVPIMKLAELVRGLSTSDETYRTALGFARSLGKEPITAPDRPGFIVNRLLVPYLLDAVRAYESGLGSLEDIDRGMTLGCGHPMGPFALIDFVGLDTTYYIANIMFEEFRDPAFAPPPLLKRMVVAGRLGRKSGRGFYTYS